MFVNFLNVVTTTRKKPPFGIAQVGKSFRNEITPQNFVFRTREFEQMEMEYFVPPDEADKWFQYWLDERMRWYLDLGIPELEAASPPPRSRRALALLDRHRGRGVPVPLGMGRARGHRQPDRLRSQGPRRALRGEARVLRAVHRRAVRALCHRARRRCHADHDGLLARRPTTRTRSAARPGRCCTSTPGWRRTRWPCCPCRRRRSSCRSLARCSGSSNRWRCVTSTPPSPSAGGIGVRTKSARRTASPSTSTLSRTVRSPVRDRDTTEQVRVPIERVVEEIAGRLRR